MEVKINCRGADTLPIAELKDFQGDLKTITPENLDKLKRSIKENGFSAPIFVWDSDKKYILDGHQRLKALEDLRGEGEEVPDVPVVYIEAADRQEAKKKLLYISSQYGEFNVSGYNLFVNDFDFSLENIRLSDGEFIPDDIEIVDDWDGELSNSGGHSSKSGLSIWIYTHMVSESREEVVQYIKDNIDKISELDDEDLIDAVVKAIDEILHS